jgi:hypothetical protein
MTPKENDSYQACLVQNFKTSGSYQGLARADSQNNDSYQGMPSDMP